MPKQSKPRPASRPSTGAEPGIVSPSNNRTTNEGRTSKARPVIASNIAAIESSALLVISSGVHRDGSFLWNDYCCENIAASIVPKENRRSKTSRFSCTTWNFTNNGSTRDGQQPTSDADNNGGYSGSDNNGCGSGTDNNDHGNNRQMPKLGPDTQHKVAPPQRGLGLRIS
jgi:hypothetical protein